MFLTFGERRRRANIDRIARDHEDLSAGFVRAASEFNTKRARLIMDALEKILDETYSEDNPGKLLELLNDLKLPSEKEWGKQINRLIIASLTTGAERATKELNDMLKNAPKFAEIPTLEPGKVLPKEAIEYAKNYSTIIAGITDDTTKESIRNVLVEGLEQGLARKDIMNNLNTATNNALSKSRLENIARTESVKFYNAGRLERYKNPALGGFIQGLQYDSVMDARTTKICNGLDGKIVDIKNEEIIKTFTPPNHYMCRATWLPVSKYEDVTFDFIADEMPQDGFTQSVDIFKGKPEDVAPKKMSVAKLKKLSADEIRLLDDDEFRRAIHYMKDPQEKWDVINERTEKFIEDNEIFKMEATKAKLKYGLDERAKKAMVHTWDTQFEIKYPDGGQPDFENLMDLIKNGKMDEANKLMDKLQEADPGGWMSILQKRSELLDPANASEMAFKFRQLPGQKVTKGMADNLKYKDFQLVKVQNGKMMLADGKAGFTKLHKEMVDETQDWMANHLDKRIGKKVKEADGIRLVFTKDDIRAFSSGRDIVMSANNKARTYIHESGHVMHSNDIEMTKAIHDWFGLRTKGQPKIEMYKHQGVSEYAIPDGFYNQYVGRIYGWDDDKQGQEVFSMGLEAMFDDPAKFYKDDPDHFKFTLSIMNGLY